MNDIAHLIAFSLHHATDNSDKTYKRFSEVFLKEGEKHSRIITFNYDTVLDGHLAKTIGPQKLYFDKIRKSHKTRLRRHQKHPDPMLLKLHGSVNWRCQTTEFYDYLLAPKSSDAENQTIDVWIADNACPTPTDSNSPLIVPPIPDKPITRISLFRYLWTRAYEYLSAAEEIVICGYSLPATDRLAVSLFGTFKNDRLKRIIIVDPNPTVLHKWRDLLKRKDVADAEWTYYDDFSHFVDRIV